MNPPIVPLFPDPRVSGEDYWLKFDKLIVEIDREFFIVKNSDGVIFYRLPSADLANVLLMFAPNYGFIKFQISVYDREKGA